MYEEGLQHRTLNVIRSAVSMTHNSIEGHPIGQHPLVSRLLKGVYNLRPPKPRYTSTWDVDKVLRYLISLGENTALSLKVLSRKLVLLMAMVTASRTSELQALDLRYRVFGPTSVTFRLASLTKKRTAGAPPKEVSFGAFPDDPHLCVVECLKCYERVTKDLRLDGSHALYILYVRPHKPVTSQRLAHWIKDLLAEGGVDTNVFKAHSVRGVSTSAAAKKGVSISDILKTADWSGESTFRKFYYRDTAESSFTKKVLSVADTEN